MDSLELFIIWSCIRPKLLRIFSSRGLLENILMICLVVSSALIGSKLWYVWLLAKIACLGIPGSNFDMCGLLAIITCLVCAVSRIGQFWEEFLPQLFGPSETLHHESIICRIICECFSSSDFGQDGAHYFGIFDDLTDVLHTISFQVVIN